MQPWNIYNTSMSVRNIDRKIKITLSINSCGSHCRTRNYSECAKSGKRLVAQSSILLTMRTYWRFGSAGDIIFGSSTASSIGREVQKLGGTKAIIVTDPNMIKTGLVNTLVTALTEAHFAAARPALRVRPASR